MQTNTDSSHGDRLCKVPEVATILALSRDTVMRKARRGTKGFPAVIDLGRNTKRFWLSEILHWIDAQRETRQNGGT